MDPGERIREWREENGFSQEELAEAWHVSQQTISNWERTGNVPAHSLFVASLNGRGWKAPRFARDLMFEMHPEYKKIGLEA